MHFDDHGQMVPPDREYLNKGVKAEGKGYLNDAMRYFKKAAALGNVHAQATIGLMHLKQEDHVSALAWLSLVDLKMIPNDAMLSALINELSLNLSDEQLAKARELKSALAESYGKHAALQNREKWRKNLKFGGTNVKGHVPVGLKIHLGAGAEQHNHPLLVRLKSNGIIVTHNQIRAQLEEFVYEYEYKFIQGQVKMDEVEIIKSDDHQ